MMSDTIFSCRRPLTVSYDHANERLDFIKKRICGQLIVTSFYRLICVVRE